jgi:hypothetical protein
MQRAVTGQAYSSASRAKSGMHSFRSMRSSISLGRPPRTQLPPIPADEVGDGVEVGEKTHGTGNGKG